MKNRKKGSDKEPTDGNTSNLFLEMKRSLKSIKKEYKELKRLTRRVKNIQKTQKAPTTPSVIPAPTPEVETEVKGLYYLKGDRTTKTDPEFKRIFDATGSRVPENPRFFMVFKGSTAVRDVTPSFDTRQTSASRERKKLIRSKKLVLDGEVYLFTEDAVFKSPSAAACVITGTATSGLKEWKEKNGRPLREPKSQLKFKL